MSWSITGVDLGRWVVEQATVRRAGVTVRRTSVQVPGRHGVIPAGMVEYDEPTVAMTLGCHGLTEADVEASVWGLHGVLGGPGSLALTRTVGGLVTTAHARLVSVAHEHVGAGYDRAVALLAVPGVFWRGEPIASVPAPASGGRIELPALAGSTAPVADAVVQVAGPLTSVQVACPVSGTGLSWAGSLPAGSYLYLDAAGVTARVSPSASAWETGGAPASSGLDYPAAGVLSLWPAMHAGDPADRRVHVTVTGAGHTAATTVAVRARPAYL